VPVRPSSAVWYTVLTALLFSACSSGQRVADGSFQKRKHRLNLSREREPAPEERPATEGRNVLVQAEPVPTDAPGEEPELLASASATLLPGPGPRSVVPRSQTARAVAGHVPDTQGSEQENLMPTKKWNHWAIPAFVAAGTAVGLGFATTSTLAVLIAVVVAIALAAIALRRGRSHELAGKGFALAALMIGMITAIALAISIAAFGFE
jgi:hypothetical protein